MSTSERAREKASTKRRDNDPVRVYADGRIAYWTGGLPGVGVRKIERTRPDDTAVRAEGTAEGLVVS